MITFISAVVIIESLTGAECQSVVNIIDTIVFSTLYPPHEFARGQKQMFCKRCPFTC